MLESPGNIRFAELDRFLQQRGFEPRQGKGSHFVYRHPNGSRLTIVKPHGGDKTINREAIRQILRVLEQERWDQDGNGRSR